MSVMIAGEPFREGSEIGSPMNPWFLWGASERVVPPRVIGIVARRLPPSKKLSLLGAERVKTQQPFSTRIEWLRGRSL